MKKFLISLFIGCSSLYTVADENILSLKYSITDNDIVYPSSFETDTKKMMENWYMQNYIELANKNNQQQPITATDDVYIQRLGLLPYVIEMPFNNIVKSNIEMYIRKRDLVERMLGMSLYYLPIFEDALDKEGLPEELKYLPVIESALNPYAKSPAKAVGLWQFMRPTAKGLGMEINSLIDERRDPIRSSEMGAKYLKQLYETFNDWSLAIAAYNCGPGNVNKAIRRSGAANPDYWAIYHHLPKETRGYVPAFIAACYIMNYYHHHNISPALAKRPLITDTIQVSRRIHFKQISAVLDIPIEEIRTLNPQYLKDVIPGDIHPYALILPSQQVHCYIMSEDSIANYDVDKYKRRTVVEPGEYFNDPNGKYIVKEEVLYHKVKKNENLRKIARRYDVDADDIKKWNGLRSNKLKRGKTLKIIKYTRTRVVKDDSTTASTNPTAIADSTSKTSADTVKPASKTETKPAYQETKPKKKEKKSQYTTHKVRKGENLGKIAEIYGVTVTQIKQANNLTDTRIQIGQRLKIPQNKIQQSNSQYTTHKVRKGENLGKIAEIYGVTVKQIQKANNISGTKIKVGQKLKIPQK
ncbi:MAG: LysM peptidoglycan-binding domain-containing protein [Muribaculaceae bacterium]|nr:LysM peptidoglycan-binding domain-containing protein [Muribaculaceae bacterium]